MRLILGLSLLIFATTAALAVSPDECGNSAPNIRKIGRMFHMNRHYSTAARTTVAE
ncbi:MAG: hypothetical protein WBE48_02780 [Xanthobacteraceae bacterium]